MHRFGGHRSACQAQQLRQVKVYKGSRKSYADKTNGLNFVDMSGDKFENVMESGT